jgi:hypothetical protein
MYGTAVHKAFEEYIRDKTPLPASYAHYKPFVEPLANFQGDVRCEEKLGIRADFTPCGFFDKDVWFRGIPDYLAINHNNGVARVADYKTGKSSRYADSAQLELMAAMVMIHHPNVNTVKGALLFVVVGCCWVLYRVVCCVWCCVLSFVVVCCRLLIMILMLILV